MCFRYAVAREVSRADLQKCRWWYEVEAKGLEPSNLLTASYARFYVVVSRDYTSGSVLCGVEISWSTTHS